MTIIALTAALTDTRNDEPFSYLNSSELRLMPSRRACGYIRRTTLYTLRTMALGRRPWQHSAGHLQAMGVRPRYRNLRSQFYLKYHLNHHRGEIRQDDSALWQVNGRTMAMGRRRNMARDMLKHMQISLANYRSGT